MGSWQEASRKSPRDVSSIDWLNDDILVRIFDYLHLDDKMRLRRVCHRWKALLEYQLAHLRALRIGKFQQSGYNLTSGLQMPTCGHQAQALRRHSGTLFSERVLRFPADTETHCFSVNQYDFLYRSLKFSQNTITVLSLGQINVTYRLLMVLAHNLPSLEHLELIACASRLDADKMIEARKLATRFVQQADLSNRDDQSLPTLDTFNTRYQTRNSLCSITIFNQHEDEFVNMHERLLRSRLLRACDLVKQTKAQNYWPRLRHLLVRQCNLLNEFSLSLLIEITKQSLTQLTIESNQYLTGEFLNYCGPQLKVLRVKYCPLLQTKFLEDLIKIRRVVSPISSETEKVNFSDRNATILFPVSS